MRWRWLAVNAGIAAPALALGGIALALLTAPEFSWGMDPLSRLGVTSAPTNLLFNLGLTVGALVAAPFGLALWRTATNKVMKAGVVVFALSITMLALVGLYPMGEPLHTPAAIGYFSLFTLAFLVWGAGAVLGGWRWGAATVGLAVVHVAAWVVWAVLAEGGVWIALPETVGALSFGGWSVVTARSECLRRLYNQE